MLQANADAVNYCNLQHLKRSKTTKKRATPLQKSLRHTVVKKNIHPSIPSILLRQNNIAADAEERVLQASNAVWLAKSKPVVAL